MFVLYTRSYVLYYCYKTSIHLHVYMYMCLYGLFCNFVVVGDCRWRAPSCLLPHGVHHRRRGASSLPNAVCAFFGDPSTLFGLFCQALVARYWVGGDLVLAFVYFDFVYWLGLFFFLWFCSVLGHVLCPCCFCSSLQMFYEIFHSTCRAGSLNLPGHSGHSGH